MARLKFRLGQRFKHTSMLIVSILTISSLKYSFDINVHMTDDIQETPTLAVGMKSLLSVFENFHVETHPTTWTTTSENSHQPHDHGDPLKSARTTNTTAASTSTATTTSGPTGVAEKLVTAVKMNPRSTKSVSAVANRATQGKVGPAQQDEEEDKVATFDEGSNLYQTDSETDDALLPHRSESRTTLSTSDLWTDSITEFFTDKDTKAEAPTVTSVEDFFTDTDNKAPAPTPAAATSTLSTADIVAPSQETLVAPIPDAVALTHETITTTRKVVASTTDAVFLTLEPVASTQNVVAQAVDALSQEHVTPIPNGIALTADTVAPTLDNVASSPEIATSNSDSSIQKVTTSTRENVSSSTDTMTSSPISRQESVQVSTESAFKSQVNAPEKSDPALEENKSKNTKAQVLTASDTLVHVAGNKAAKPENSKTQDTLDTQVKVPKTQLPIKAAVVDGEAKVSDLVQSSTVSYTEEITSTKPTTDENEADDGVDHDAVTLGDDANLEVADKEVDEEYTSNFISNIVSSLVGSKPQFEGLEFGLQNGENVTKIAYQLFKLVTKYKIQSMVDISCTTTYHWMPHFLNYVSFTVPGFEYSCIVFNEDDLHTVSPGYERHFPDAKVYHYRKDHKNYPQADLVLTWDHVPKLSATKVWWFFKDMRNSKSKYLVTSNYPSFRNNPGDIGRIGKINLGLPPFSFREPIKRVYNVQLENEMPKQLLFYSLKKIRENL